MKRVLVTGVTGMDGSNMVDYLLKNTDHIIIGMVRRLSVPNHKNLEAAIKNPRFILHSADLTDQASINQLVTDTHPDYLINFAAQSFVAESWNSPENTFNVDALGVLRCLEAIRRFQPACRFYSAGSSEEWGDVVFSPQTMEHPIRPRSPYGASKASARHLVKVYRESYGLYAIHGILFNHEGVRRGEEFVTRKITKGVARILKALKNNQYDFQPLELGNLEAYRDWSDSEDFVDGVWRMLNQDIYRTDVKSLIEEFDRTGKLLLPREVNPAWHSILVRNLKEYILSSDECHTVREFVEKAFNCAQIECRWWNPTDKPEDEELILFRDGLATKRRIPLAVINKKFYRPAEVQLLVGDSTPARKELQWQPKVSFEELVFKMVANDISHELL